MTSGSGRNRARARIRRRGPECRRTRSGRRERGRSPAATERDDNRPPEYEPHALRLAGPSRPAPLRRASRRWSSSSFRRADGCSTRCLDRVRQTLLRSSGCRKPRLASRSRRYSSPGSPAARSRAGRQRSNSDLRPRPAPAAAPNQASLRPPAPDPVTRRACRSARYPAPSVQVRPAGPSFPLTYRSLRGCRK